MSKSLNLVNNRFGRLVVIKRVANNKRGRTRWLCECDCGNKTIVLGMRLKNQDTKSCGCFRDELAKTMGLSRLRHGHKRFGQMTRVYSIWGGMIKRCSNSGHRWYKNYGGRGIAVCARWRKFENFLKDMGEPPTDEHQIDRVDNDGHYEPKNCRWVTRSQNGRNKRNNRLITMEKRTQCITAWSQEVGISVQTIVRRIKSGWSIEAALSTPVRGKKEVSE